MAQTFSHIVKLHTIMSYQRQFNSLWSYIEQFEGHIRTLKYIFDTNRSTTKIGQNGCIGLDAGAKYIQYTVYKTVCEEHRPAIWERTWINKIREATTNSKSNLCTITVFVSFIL